MNKDSLIPGFAGRALRFEPATGFLYWADGKKSGQRADIAGSCGYRIVCFRGRQYQAHRIAWFLMTGKVPKFIDHKNGSRSDNRWENLRETDLRLNPQNRRSARAGNKTGFLGVSQRGRVYHASIKVDGRNIHLGDHATPEEAHAAYVLAKRRLHEACTL